MPESKSVRDSFVTRFGEDQAAAIERAAESHKNGVHDNPGSDAFKWAFLICVGFECISRDSFREYHGITAPFAGLKQWAVVEGQLGSHDGDVDFISLFCCVYNEYIPLGSLKQETSCKES